jgi:hypothetical protein
MSRRKAKKIHQAREREGNRVAKALNERAKSCKKLKDKHWTDIDVIKLDHISIGDLRQGFSPQHQPLPPNADEEVLSFKFLPSPDDGRPLAIYGSDNHLLALRVRSKKPKDVEKLAEAIDKVPEMKEWISNRIYRGPYKSMHLGTWGPYMPKPQTTAEQREAGAAATELLATAKPIFDEMTTILGGVEPGVFKEFQRRPLPEDAQRACGAWASCVVNNGGIDADEGDFHRDVRESPFGFSCAIACGDFEDGHLIMYELGVMLQMKSCDITLFPDSLITHKTTKVKGRRKSVVAFTQANMFEYWSRILPDVNVPWDGWLRIYSNGEKKIVRSSHSKVKKDPRECWRPKGKIIPGPRATRSGARY